MFFNAGGYEAPIMVCVIYDETMEHVSVDERAATSAITIAEHREWP